MIPPPSPDVGRRSRRELVNRLCGVFGHPDVPLGPVYAAWGAVQRLMLSPGLTQAGPTHDMRVDTIVRAVLRERNARRAGGATLTADEQNRDYAERLCDFYSHPDFPLGRLQDAWDELLRGTWAGENAVLYGIIRDTGLSGAGGQNMNPTKTAAGTARQKGKQDGI